MTSPGHASCRVHARAEPDAQARQNHDGPLNSSGRSTTATRHRPNHGLAPRPRTAHPAGSLVSGGVVTMLSAARTGKNQIVLQRLSPTVAVVLLLCLVPGAGWTTPPPAPRVSPAAAPADEGDTTVYVTRTGKKYHRDGCRSLSRSRIPMKLSEAAKRYGRCAVCRPPVLRSDDRDRNDPPERSARCAATTRKGTQCSRRATRGAYCWQHAR